MRRARTRPETTEDLPSSIAAEARIVGLRDFTTPSLEALRKYVEGLRIIYEGDFPRGEALLQEAVTLDTGFAMAYRKLAVEYGNRFLMEKAQTYSPESTSFSSSATPRIPPTKQASCPRSNTPHRP